MFDDCPNICGETGHERRSFCSNCPVRDERELFEQAAGAELEKLGPNDRYSFEYLNQCVLDAINFQALPADRRTITVARMIDVLDAEKARERRVAEWNKQKAAS